MRAALFLMGCAVGALLILAAEAIADELEYRADKAAMKEEVRRYSTVPSEAFTTLEEGTA